MEKFCNRCHKPISEEVFDYSKEHFFKALCREHQPTPEAKRLGELLKKYGYNVEFEKDDGFKHIDIAIVNKKVNIEVDGRQHHSKEQALRDLKRTFYSWKKDYVTLRIPNALTKDDATITETAEYIDKFLQTERTQLEKEINKEMKEDYPFWKDVNKIINSASNIVSNVSNSLNNAFKKF